MSQSFRETVGIPPSSAGPSDSALLIIDAQNEYVNGLLKTVNVDSTRAAIAGLVDKYRVAGQESNIVHILHKVPDGAPVFTPGKPVSKEMDGVEAKGNEKVGGKSSWYLLVVTLRRWAACVVVTGEIYVPTDDLASAPMST